jgi:parvulin-like peptidyl-prolyl isomerase
MMRLCARLPRSFIAHAACLIAATACGSSTSAQEQPVVVARIGSAPVRSDEVDRELRQAYGAEVDLAKIPAEVRQRAARQVVDRRLVLSYLHETKQGASSQDLEFALEQLRKELKAQNVSFEEYLRRGNWREEDFRRHLAWKLSWDRFLATALTDANLQKFFDRHLPDFDGREMRVAHILLKADPADVSALEKAMAEARQIRQDIAAGKLSFADAAKKHSQAPTAAGGGDIGFIQRREPMPEAFSKAALWLKEGEISEPVVSTFGVHLIQSLEVRPGKRTWKDAEGELRKAVAHYLFQWAADKQRAKTKVEWFENERSSEPPSTGSNATSKPGN